MSEIEKIKEYVEKTGIDRKLFSRYSMRPSEVMALSNECSKIDAICMAFTFGAAKGYRAGRKAVERK